MGVETIWIIDPRIRTGRTYIPIDVNRLEVFGTPLLVDLGEIFAQIG